MDELVRILGIIGAYFAILLVLAVSIETILEPISYFKGLRKKIDPEEVLKDLNAWLPANSDAGAKAAAIANLTSEYQATVADLDKRVEEIKTIASETAKGLGITGQVDELQNKVAIRLAALREKYALTERRRITLLRSISAGVGILVAILLQINTFELLAALFPQGMPEFFATPYARYGGMVITGLAASAGSSFWHDQLGKLRAIKDAARAGESS